MNTYINNQLKRIEKNPSEYLKTIKISNGKDYSTHELNITDEIYQKIKNILINTIE